MLTVPSYNGVSGQTIKEEGTGDRSDNAETGHSPVPDRSVSDELDQIDFTGKGVLSSTEILQEIDSGNVVIEPFSFGHLSNCSYDVSLGDYYYRHATDPQNPLMIYNPWNPDHVRRYWGQAEKAIEVDETTSVSLGLVPGTKYILIYPGETILAHTQEFIGGRGHITTMMKARSSMGRSGISICKDAGWGDIGYINRWTLEITNFVRVPVALLVGERIGQIVFFYTGKPITPYNGNYQESDVLESLIKDWKPSQMLPRPRRDRE